MPDARINVPLDKGEFTALLQMSASDCRAPREQMRFLLREEACRRGLLEGGNHAGGPDERLIAERDVCRVLPAPCRSNNPQSEG